jgi:hypothetical protein
VHQQGFVREKSVDGAVLIGPGFQDPEKITVARLRVDRLGEGVQIPDLVLIDEVRCPMAARQAQQVADPAAHPIQYYSGLMLVPSGGLGDRVPKTVGDLYEAQKELRPLGQTILVHEGEGLQGSAVGKA